MSKSKTETPRPLPPDQTSRPRTVTSVDVAREAGVSQATVSLVLTGKAGRRVSAETQSSVLNAVARLGYRPNAAAQSLRLGRPRMVGLAVPTVANPYFASVLVGAEQAARDKGYAVVLVDMGEGDDWHEWLPDLLAVRGLDGCILYAAGPVLPAEIQRLGHNVVLIEAEAEGASSVLLDIEDSTSAAMAHLLGLGHRRIGHLGADIRKETYQTREHAYRRALQEAGLRYRPSDVARSSFGIASSAAAATRLLDQRQRPTAILCDDDLLAAGVYKAAKALGLSIPDDLSVVGFDDIEFARMLEPELTTVRIPASEVGSVAMQCFLDLVERNATASTRLPCALVVRGSTARAPAG
jgi:LacI family repressor for deo operon, udp, cdd, tsx, nupC, and nupG